MSCEKRLVVSMGLPPADELAPSIEMPRVERGTSWNKRANEGHRESGRGNSRATAAYGRAHNVLLVHTKKSFP